MITYQTLRHIIDGAISGTLTEQECYRQLVYHITQKLHSRQASIWYFQDTEVAVSQISYNVELRTYSSGQILHKSDGKDIFIILKSGNMVSMPDVSHHYLTPSIGSNILFQPDTKSLFAIPITFRSKSVGFVCSEHNESKTLKLQYNEIAYLDTVVSLVTHLLFNLHPQKQ